MNKWDVWSSNSHYYFSSSLVAKIHFLKWINRMIGVWTLTIAYNNTLSGEDSILNQFRLIDKARISSTICFKNLNAYTYIINYDLLIMVTFHYKRNTLVNGEGILPCILITFKTYEEISTFRYIYLKKKKSTFRYIYTQGLLGYIY